MFNEIVNLLKNQTIMKKLITITFLSGLCFILFQSSIYKVMRVQGAEPGHTGSPGDGKDCTVCHGGDATTVAGWITSNIPASGYVPGERYTITTTNNEVEGNRFGFQVSPQNVAGDLLGTLIVTDSVETQLVGDGKYMTYTENGVFGISSKTWTFDWIAPSEDVDEVTFYGAYNSNFEGHKGSNHVFLSTLKVNRGWGASVNQTLNKDFDFKCYPNPAKDFVNISFNLKTETHLVLNLMDAKGQLVNQLLNGKFNGTVKTNFYTDLLPNGNYFVLLNVDGKVTTHKMSVIH